MIGPRERANPLMPTRHKQVARMLIGAIVIAAAIIFYLGSTFR
jgi:hypothetical protein